MIHKTTRSILSVLLAVLLLVTSTPLTPAFAGGGGAVSPQSESGEGRALEQAADGTYLIYTAENLKEFAAIVNGTAEGIAQNTSANAKLMNDIDLSSVCGESLNGGTSWIPIGTSSGYSGNFNGDGHTISGLYIDSNADEQGLFGYVSTGGKVQNLSVSGSVSGNRSVGGVVGQNNGTVTNCAFSGSVKGSGNRVGGVVGYNHGSVENCYNTGAVNSSGNRVGGVVGDNYIGGSVTNCYNTGSVSGGNRVGGVVGYNLGSVENCYNTGKVSGNNYVGGVVGDNTGGRVENCYNTGSVTSSGSPVGGVVGTNEAGASVANCYFLQTDGVPANGIGSGTGSTENVKSLTAEEFKNQNSFTHWDFGSTDIPGIWETNTTLNRPVLTSNHEDDGSKDHPYRISTATQLKNFATAVNGGEKSAHAKLMNNIDLNGSETNQWTPIGNSSNEYTGTFNGQNFKISGLYIKNTSSDTDYQGLFGYLGTGGKVQNLSVSGTVNSSGWYVGGVVGQNFGGTVENCYNTVTVSGSDRVGGVVGQNFGGTVENCYNTDTVSGSNHVGGVVGYNSGTVENCHNTGKVTGSSDYSYIGGVVGGNISSGNVKNCYNIGSVTATGIDGRVGGVVGYNDSSASVANCYNTGTVSDGTTSGGVVGQNFGSGSVTNCYFLQTADVNKDLQGIGSGTGTATEKDDNAFHSGEVAWLLQAGQKAAGEEDPIPQVWGQSNLTTDKSWPTLVALDKNENAKPVYKVAFISDNTEIEAKYANSGMTVGSPTTNPTKEGYTFAGWFTESSGGSQWNFSTAVTENMTLYAQWTPVAEPDPDPEPTPEPEPEEPPYSGKYSYELSTSVGDHGSLTVDRYATEGDKVTITISPDDAYKLDDLTVTANGKDVELTANSDGTYTFTMPSADVRITATFAEDPDWTEPEEPATDVSDLFIDIAPDAWYKDAIQYAYDNGLMTGVSDTEFAPEQTTTRAMIVSILARLEGATTAQAAGFADVTDEWYATAVNWAANVGVVNGYEDNTFQPNTAITREQLAAILMNYAAYKGEDVSNRADLANYTDQPSTWAEEAMQWAVAEGLISGVTNTELQPQGNATRAQVAAILQRFLEA